MGSDLLRSAFYGVRVWVRVRLMDHAEILYLIYKGAYTFLVANNYVESKIQKGFVPRISGTFEHIANLSYLVNQAHIKQRSFFFFRVWEINFFPAY